MNEKNRFNETETEMNEGAMPEETVSETEETGDQTTETSTAPDAETAEAAVEAEETSAADAETAEASAADAEMSEADTQGEGIAEEAQPSNEDARKQTASLSSKSQRMSKAMEPHPIPSPHKENASWTHKALRHPETKY